MSACICRRADGMLGGDRISRSVRMDRYRLYRGDKLLGWFECETKIDEKVVSGIGYLHLESDLASGEGVTQHVFGPFLPPHPPGRAPAAPATHAPPTSHTPT